MRVFLILFVLLVGPISTFSQVNRRVIMWSHDPGCGFRRNIDLTKEFVSCSSVTTERGHVSILRHDSLMLAIVLGFEDDRLVISTSIKNSSEEPVIFDSDDWGAAHYRSMEDARVRKPPVFAELSIPSRDIVRGIRARELRNNQLETQMADLSVVNEPYVYRNPDGRLVRTTRTVQDQNEKATAVRRMVSRNELNANQQSEIRRSALTAKTVNADSSVKGLVYFRREKKAPYTIISMPIGDTLYVIHFLHRNQKQ